MEKWLVIGLAASFLWASAANAQAKRVAAGEIAGPHALRSHDLRMAPLPPASTPPHHFIGGMIVSQDVAANATIGLGFASIGRRKGGADFQIGVSHGRSRRPAVTFLLHF